MSKSSIRPGVPIMIFPPSFLNFSMSSLNLVPPIKSCCLRLGIFSKNFDKTWLICEASSRVGLRIRAPIWLYFNGSSKCVRISKMGRRKAKVLPLPVTASAATSFLSRKSGIVVDCKKETKMVFCCQNCSDLMWEKTDLVIEKNFWNFRVKAENFQKFWDQIFGNRMLF